MALNNVPTAGQTLATTRDPINQNFSVIDAAFSVDHVDYNTTNQGTHNKVSFPTQASNPPFQAGIVQLFSLMSSITGQPELFYERQSGSNAPNPVKTVEFTSAAWANPGWTRLPSGILLIWQQGIGFGSGSALRINLNAYAGFPSYQSLLNVLITPYDSASSYNNVIGLTSINIPQFNFVVSAFNGSVPPSSVSFSFLSIGY